MKLGIDTDRLVIAKRKWLWDALATLKHLVTLKVKCWGERNMNMLNFYGGISLLKSLRSACTPVRTVKAVKHVN